MDDLRELYQTTILDHNKKPRNFRKPEAANRHADGYNPLCGDKVTVYLEVDGDRISDIGFQGNGCAISTASASLMTQSLKGKTLAEAQELFEAFHELVTSDPTQAAAVDGVGKLAVFSGVREYPMRVKCATLAWHTMRAAADGDEAVAKTE